MPLIVDSDERRAAVAAAAADLIAEGGLNAVTFRNLATRLGFSTTVISHYFTDKIEVLRETYRHVIAQAIAHRERMLTGSSASPVRALEELLPLSPAPRRIWTIWIYFWTAALFESELLEEHRLGLAGTRERLQIHFIETGLSPEVAQAHAEDITKTLFGIAMQALFDPAYWTADRQRSAYRRTIKALGLSLA